MSPATGARVVSLVPSVTESLLAWGITPVAVTRFCEHPELPAVGGTKNPDVAAIVALRPDLVVLNDEENRVEDHDALVAAGLGVHVVVVRSVDDVALSLRALARAVGVREGAATPVVGAPFDRDPPVRARAFVPIWRRPWMSLARDTYGASVLRRLGVVGVFDDAGARYPEVSLDDVAARRPDLVVVPDEPYAFRPVHLEELAAVAPVVAVDGRDLFWWGTRTAAALDRLAAAVAPWVR